MTNSQADVWIIAGAPGAGKTTVAQQLLPQLHPAPALLDKDTLYDRFVVATLRAANQPLGLREGPWYEATVKPIEYDSMAALTREIRAHGCPVALVAPFTVQLHDVHQWHEWVQRVGGPPVHLVWVRTDEDTMHERLRTRNSERDSEKFADFDAFATRMQLDHEPQMPHHTIDNRFSAPASLPTQVQALAARVATR